MDLLVFKVDHGLCVFVRTPNGYGVMIDIGSSEQFKPTSWLANENNLRLNRHKGRRVSWLVVTHPHDDHVEGIDDLIQRLQPAILLRHKDYDWPTILDPAHGEPSKNAKRYHEWEQGYAHPVTDYPDLGCDFKKHALTPKEAGLLGGQPNNILNNTSYVCVFSWADWKMVVCGDNEEAGLEALLSTKPDFAKDIAGADILVTPHHGHKSGYSNEFLKAIGRPFACISSVQAKDEHTDDRYTEAASGLNYLGEKRSHFTTRNDGHLWLQLTPGKHYKFNSVATGLVGVPRASIW